MIGNLLFFRLHLRYIYYSHSLIKSSHFPKLFNACHDYPVAIFAREFLFENEIYQRKIQRKKTFARREGERGKKKRKRGVRWSIPALGLYFQNSVMWMVRSRTVVPAQWNLVHTSARMLHRLFTGLFIITKAHEAFNVCISKTRGTMRNTSIIPPIYSADHWAGSTHCRVESGTTSRRLNFFVKKRKRKENKSSL